MKQSDLNILDKGFSNLVNEEQEPVFPIYRVLSVAEEENKDSIFTPAERELFTEVDKSLNASKGARKIMASLFGDTTVQVSAEETELLAAINRVFGETRSEISFEMFNHCIETLALIGAEARKEAMLNELRS